MFWKLVVLVLTIGGTCCGLLVLRQQEIDLLASETDLLREAKKIEQSLQMNRWELEQLTQDARFERWFREQEIQLEPVDQVRLHEENHASAPGPLDDPSSDAIAFGREDDRRIGW
jgi:hypothetical protein